MNRNFFHKQLEDYYQKVVSSWGALLKTSHLTALYNHYLEISLKIEEYDTFGKIVDKLPGKARQDILEEQLSILDTPKYPL